MKDSIYYFDDSGLIGRKDSSGIYFYHSDQLGSTSVVTDKNGNVVERTTYEPYGNVLSGGESKFLYTGKEKDSTGLYYYGARYYDPALMHFTQADTVIGDVYNPLSLNRYAYALNNPYKYTDPSGHVAGICIDLCISDFAIIGGFILVYAALILFEYSFIAIESLSEDMTYRTPGATEYENGLEYKTPGINEDVNINVPVDAPTIEIDDYTRLPGPTGYSYDLPLEFPSSTNFDLPFDLLNPMKYKDEDIAPEELRHKKLPKYDPNFRNDWREILDYKNYRPFMRGYYDVNGWLRIREDYTDHGFPDNDYPGHKHKYEPLDPKSPNKGVKRLPGKEPIR